MNPQLKAFFAKVTSDKALQEQLYLTKELSDVAIIANQMGFNLTAADILKAQAGRVLSLPLEEIEDLAAGRRAKSGAQWGRAGKGYLDRAGFWLLEFEQWGCTLEPNLIQFISEFKKEEELQVKLFTAKHCNDVASIAIDAGFDLSGSFLVRTLAKQILELSFERATKVACGAGDQIS